MKMEWEKYLGKTLHITLHENYGMTIDPHIEGPIYEIVFKAGKLNNVFDDGLLLETIREAEKILIFIPYSSIKCVEIFNF